MEWGGIIPIGYCAVCGARVGIAQAHTSSHPYPPLYHDVSRHSGYSGVQWAATLSGRGIPECSTRPIRWTPERQQTSEEARATSAVARTDRIVAG